MEKTDLESALRLSFEDHLLSRNEKYALDKVFDELKGNHEKLNFLRNCTFDIVFDCKIESYSMYHETIKWLESVLKLIDKKREVEKIKTPRAYFSPGRECSGEIRTLIKQSVSSIDICVFTISDNEISEEILLAYKNGIKVRIITDDNKSDDAGSDIARFVEEGISVRMDNSPSHMHHKFAIFDDEVLLNGSFNWTRSASDYNQENITVNYDHELVGRFRNVFEELWEKFK